MGGAGWSHRAGYRVRQLGAALAARRHPPDDRAARRLLPPPLLAIFARMPAEDRRHALAVLAALEAAGWAEVPLLQAALLHDAGKAEAGIRLWHRAARVLLTATATGAWQRLSACPTGRRRPLWVLAEHPARGAVWVEAQGGGADLVALIRYHESDAPADWAGRPLADWHAALQRADGAG